MGSYKQMYVPHPWNAKLKLGAGEVGTGTICGILSW